MWVKSQVCPDQGCRPPNRAGGSQARQRRGPGFGAGTELIEASDETVAPPPPHQVSLSGWHHRSGLNPSRPLVSQWVFLRRRRVICGEGCWSALWRPGSVPGPPSVLSGRSMQHPRCHGACSQPGTHCRLSTLPPWSPLSSSLTEGFGGMWGHTLKRGTRCLQTPEGLPGLVRARMPTCVES